MRSLNYDIKWHRKCKSECMNCEVPGRDGEISFIPWYLPTLVTLLFVVPPTELCWYWSWPVHDPSSSLCGCPPRPWCLVFSFVTHNPEHLPMVTSHQDLRAHSGTLSRVWRVNLDCHDNPVHRCHIGKGCFSWVSAGLRGWGREGGGGVGHPPGEAGVI